MQWDLSNHQLKIVCYKHSLVCIKHMVTTNQKSARDTPEIKMEEFKHNTTESHQHTKEEKKLGLVVYFKLMVV